MDKQVTGTIKSIARSGSRSTVRKTKDKESRLQLLVDNTPDMLAVLDMNGRLLYTSPSSLGLLGIKPERLHGRTLYDLIYPADCERARLVQETSADNDELAACEFRMRHANGNVVWVEMRSHRARDNDHDEIVAVFRNINERHIEEMFAAEQRRHLEEQLEARGWQIEMTADLLNKQIAEHKQDKLALEHSEMRYTALVENTLTGIYIHDGRKMIYCNDRFAQIFGFDRDCLESMDTDEMFAGGRSIESLLSEMSQEALVKGKTCTGRQIWLKLSRARITCSGQSMVIGNVIDVTEQIETQERLMASELELHTLSAQLMAAQESERKRIANELHDGLGQRLSAIKFAVENVWRTTDKEMFPEQARRLADVVETIRDSIEEVRRVSMDLRPSILDDLGLIATIGWFCREFGQLFPNIGIHHSVSAAETDIPDEVKVVIFRIMQEAFHNIARHAQADQVELELLCYNNNLHLLIRDNGRGISSIDHSPCAKGLGLKSMRERAELTHGEFRVDSVPGRGTTIFVQWPRTIN